VPAPFLSIVVPVFNEGPGIADCVQRLADYLDGIGARWEIVIADDGSTDATVAIASAIAARDARVRLSGGAHRGKGAAVRRGMLAATGDWRFMADADLSMPPAEIARFLDLARRNPAHVHVVVASREAPGARRIGEPWRRHAVGRVFNRLVQVLVLPGIDDTQCGFKLFSARAATAVFPRTTLDGFAFDVEVLLLARRAGFTVHEIGIEWHCRPDSRVSVWRGAAAFADVLRVRWNAWTGRYRREPIASASGDERIDNVPRRAGVR
jgi:glycosyltransferase involved in cell wall biosynthesis